MSASWRRESTALSLPTKKHAENVIDAVLGSSKPPCSTIRKRTTRGGRKIGSRPSTRSARRVALQCCTITPAHIATHERVRIRKQETQGSVRIQILKRYLHPILLDSDGSPESPGRRQASTPSDAIATATYAAGLRRRFAQVLVGTFATSRHERSVRRQRDDGGYRMEMAGTRNGIRVELYRMYRKRKRGDWSSRL